MPLYSFQSPQTIARLANKIVAVDASYLISLTNASDHHYSAVFSFHTQAIQNRTRFLINATARQEFTVSIRNAVLVEALFAAQANDPILRTRYETLLNLKSKPISLDIIRSSKNREILYKDHIRSGDSQLFLRHFTRNVWSEVEMLEQSTDMEYISASNRVSWNDIGRLIQATGLSPSDAIISHDAFAVNADAIVTCDADFTSLVGSIDVYLPREIAVPCAVYDPSID